MRVIRLETGSARSRSASLLALSILIASMSSAAAATPTTCVFDDTTGTAVVAVTDGGVATIARSGEAVTVDGIACQTATVTNTDLIQIELPGISEAETVVVDLSAGPLAPGATDEGDGSSEIELEVELDGAPIGTFDKLQIAGSGGADTIDVQQDFSVNLNADEETYDDDVAILGDGELELLGGDGNDLLSLEGYGETALIKAVRGGPGDDLLIGDLGASLLDGGPGRDVADYSSAFFHLALSWGEAEAFIFGSFGDEDDLVDMEVAILSDEQDTVLYEGAATGETFLGPGVDTVFVQDPVAGGDSDERIIHGGPGTLDFIEFGSSPARPVTVALTGNTIGGSWTATYSGIEYVRTQGGDDRFRIGRRGTYPGIIGGDGKDVLDLRAATQGISVTMGHPTFGRRKWLTAFEVERVLGSAFDDVFLGPAVVDANDPMEFIGFLGRDVLSGGEGPDLLVGGEGPDKLSGNGGADTLKGWLGADLIDGGSGADTLRGGPGNDELDGGSGADVCSGGPGVDTVSGC